MVSTGWSWRTGRGCPWSLTWSRTARLSAESSEWPTAAEWLAAGGDGSLVVAGVPVVEGAVTPSRYDCTPAAIRSRLEKLSTFHGERGINLPPVLDLGD